MKDLRNFLRKVLLLHCRSHLLLPLCRSSFRRVHSQATREDQDTRVSAYACPRVFRFDSGACARRQLVFG